LDDLPFDCCENLQRRCRVLQPCPDAFEHTIDSIVVPEWIMMGQCEPFDLRTLAELYDVFYRAVAPAYLGGVLGGGILGIMDEKICATDKFRMPQILAYDIPLAACQGSRVRLVVAAIHERRPVHLQSIAKRERRMIQIMGGNLYLVEIKGAFDEVVIANRGSKLIGRDREIGVFPLPRERLAQGLAETFGAINVP